MEYRSRSGMRPLWATRLMASRMLASPALASRMLAARALASLMLAALTVGLMLALSGAIMPREALAADECGTGSTATAGTSRFSSYAEEISYARGRIVRSTIGGVERLYRADGIITGAPGGEDGMTAANGWSANLGDNDYAANQIICDETDLTTSTPPYDVGIEYSEADLAIVYRRTDAAEFISHTGAGGEIHILSGSVVLPSTSTRATGGVVRVATATGSMGDIRIVIASGVTISNELGGSSSVGASNQGTGGQDVYMEIAGDVSNRNDIAVDAFTLGGDIFMTVSGNTSSGSTVATQATIETRAAGETHIDIIGGTHTANAGAAVTEFSTNTSGQITVDISSGAILQATGSSTVGINIDSGSATATTARTIATGDCPDVTDAMDDDCNWAGNRVSSAGMITGDFVSTTVNDLFENALGGVFTGDINMGAATDEFRNAGTATIGSMDLGAGNDVFHNTGTATIGSMDLGAGNDALTNQGTLTLGTGRGASMDFGAGTDSFTNEGTLVIEEVEAWSADVDYTTGDRFRIGSNHFIVSTTMQTEIDAINALPASTPPSTSTAGVDQAFAAAATGLESFTQTSGILRFRLDASVIPNSALLHLGDLGSVLPAFTAGAIEIVDVNGAEIPSGGLPLIRWTSTSNDPVDISGLTTNFGVLFVSASRLRIDLTRYCGNAPRSRDAMAPGEAVYEVTCGTASATGIATSRRGIALLYDAPSGITPSIDWRSQGGEIHINAGSIVNPATSAAGAAISMRSGNDGSFYLTTAEGTTVSNLDTGASEEGIFVSLDAAEGAHGITLNIAGDVSTVGRAGSGAVEAFITDEDVTGDIDVTVSGDTSATGAGSDAIVASNAGTGDVSVSITGGTHTVSGTQGNVQGAVVLNSGDGTGTGQLTIDIAEGATVRAIGAATRAIFLRGSNTDDTTDRVATTGTWEGNRVSSGGAIIGDFQSFAGNDLLEITPTGSFAGALDMGAGADELDMRGRFAGTLDMGGGDDRVNNHGVMRITGDSDFGGGTDGLVLEEGGTIIVDVAANGGMPIAFNNLEAFTGGGAAEAPVLRFNLDPNLLPSSVTAANALLNLGLSGVAQFGSNLISISIVGGVGGAVIPLVAQSTSSSGGPIDRAATSPTADPIFSAGQGTLTFVNEGGFDILQITLNAGVCGKIPAGGEVVCDTAQSDGIAADQDALKIFYAATSGNTPYIFHSGDGGEIHVRAGAADIVKGADYLLSTPALRLITSATETETITITTAAGTRVANMDARSGNHAIRASGGGGVSLNIAGSTSALGASDAISAQAAGAGAVNAIISGGTHTTSGTQAPVTAIINLVSTGTGGIGLTIAQGATVGTAGDAARRAVRLQTTVSAEINNRGTVYGVIQGSGIADRFTNAGAFTGSFDLGAGDDAVINAGLMTITASPDFGLGTDSLTNTGTFALDAAPAIASVAAWSADTDYAMGDRFRVGNNLFVVSTSMTAEIMAINMLTTAPDSSQTGIAISNPITFAGLESFTQTSGILQFNIANAGAIPSAPIANLGAVTPTLTLGNVRVTAGEGGIPAGRLIPLLQADSISALGGLYSDQGLLSVVSNVIRITTGVGRPEKRCGRRADPALLATPGANARVLSCDNRDTYSGGIESTAANLPIYYRDDRGVYSMPYIRHFATGGSILIGFDPVRRTDPVTGDRVLLAPQAVTGTQAIVKPGGVFADGAAVAVLPEISSERIGRSISVMTAEGTVIRNIDPDPGNHGVFLRLLEDEHDFPNIGITPTASATIGGTVSALPASDAVRIEAYTAASLTVGAAGNVIGSVRLIAPSAAISNAGAITGDLILGSSPATFANSGTFTGNLRIGGALTFNNTGGTFTGSLTLGAAGDKAFVNPADSVFNFRGASDLGEGENSFVNQGTANVARSGRVANLASFTNSGEFFGNIGGITGGGADFVNEGGAIITLNALAFNGANDGATGRTLTNDGTILIEAELGAHNNQVWQPYSPLVAGSQFSIGDVILRVPTSGNLAHLLLEISAFTPPTPTVVQPSVTPTGTPRPPSDVPALAKIFGSVELWSANRVYRRGDSFRVIRETSQLGPRDDVFFVDLDATDQEIRNLNALTSPPSPPDANPGAPDPDRTGSNFVTGGIPAIHIGDLSGGSFSVATRERKTLAGVQNLVNRGVISDSFSSERGFAPWSQRTGTFYAPGDLFQAGGTVYALTAAATGQELADLNALTAAPTAAPDGAPTPAAFAAATDYAPGDVYTIGTGGTLMYHVVSPDITEDQLTALNGLAAAPTAAPDGVTAVAPSDVPAWSRRTANIYAPGGGFRVGGRPLRIRSDITGRDLAAINRAATAPSRETASLISSVVDTSIPEWSATATYQVGDQFRVGNIVFSVDGGTTGTGPVVQLNDYLSAPLGPIGTSIVARSNVSNAEFFPAWSADTTYEAGDIFRIGEVVLRVDPGISDSQLADFNSHITPPSIYDERLQKANAIGGQARAGTANLWNPDTVYAAGDLFRVGGNVLQVDPSISADDLTALNALTERQPPTASTDGLRRHPNDRDRFYAYGLDVPAYDGIVRNYNRGATLVMDDQSNIFTNEGLFQGALVMGGGDDQAVNRGANSIMYIMRSADFGDGADSLTNEGLLVLAQDGLLRYPALIGLETLTNAEGAEIVGDVIADQDNTPTRFINRGIFSGRISLGGGDDIFQNAAPLTIAGRFDFGEGNDRLENSGIITLMPDLRDSGNVITSITTGVNRYVPIPIAGGERIADGHYRLANVYIREGASFPGLERFVNQEGGQVFGTLLDIFGDRSVFQFANAGSFTGSLQFRDGADSVQNTGTMTLTSPSSMGDGADSFTNLGNLVIRGLADPSRTQADTAISGLDSFTLGPSGSLELHYGANSAQFGAIQGQLYLCPTQNQVSFCSGVIQARGDVVLAGRVNLRGVHSSIRRINLVSPDATVNAEGLTVIGGRAAPQRAGEAFLILRNGPNLQVLAVGESLQQVSVQGGVGDAAATAATIDLNARGAVVSSYSQTRSSRPAARLQGTGALSLEVGEGSAVCSGEALFAEVGTERQIFCDTAVHQAETSPPPAAFFLGSGDAAITNRGAITGRIDLFSNGSAVIDNRGTLTLAGFSNFFSDDREESSLTNTGTLVIDVTAPSNYDAVVPNRAGIIGLGSFNQDAGTLRFVFDPASTTGPLFSLDVLNARFASGRLEIVNLNNDLQRGATIDLIVGANIPSNIGLDASGLGSLSFVGEGADRTLRLTLTRAILAHFCGGNPITQGNAPVSPGTATTQILCDDFLREGIAFSRNDVALLYSFPRALPFIRHTGAGAEIHLTQGSGGVVKIANNDDAAAVSIISASQSPVAISVASGVLISNEDELGDGNYGILAQNGGNIALNIAGNVFSRNVPAIFARSARGNVSLIASGTTSTSGQDAPVIDVLTSGSGNINVDVQAGTHTASSFTSGGPAVITLRAANGQVILNVGAGATVRDTETPARAILITSTNTDAQTARTVGGGTWSGNRITNAGTIQGSLFSGAGAELLEIAQTGRFIGAANTAGGADEIRNAGAFIGAASMGAGADAIVNQGAMTISSLSMGEGNDAFQNLGQLTISAAELNFGTGTDSFVSAGAMFIDAAAILNRFALWRAPAAGSSNSYARGSQFRVGRRLFEVTAAAGSSGDAQIMALNALRTRPTASTAGITEITPAVRLQDLESFAAGSPAGAQQQSAITFTLPISDTLLAPLTETTLASRGGIVQLGSAAPNFANLEIVLFPASNENPSAASGTLSLFTGSRITANTNVAGITSRYGTVMRRAIMDSGSMVVGHVVEIEVSLFCGGFVATRRAVAPGVATREVVCPLGGGRGIRVGADQQRLAVIYQDARGISSIRHQGAGGEIHIRAGAGRIVNFLSFPVGEAVGVVTSSTDPVYITTAPGTSVSNLIPFGGSSHGITGQGAGSIYMDIAGSAEVASPAASAIHARTTGRSSLIAINIAQTAAIRTLRSATRAITLDSPANSSAGSQRTLGPRTGSIWTGNRVSNAGTITGDFQGSRGNDLFENAATGSFTGAFNPGGGVNEIFNAGAMTFRGTLQNVGTLTNTGTIGGEGGTLTLDDGNTVFTHSGVLTGNLDMGGGDDILIVNGGSAGSPVVLAASYEFGAGEDLFRNDGFLQVGGNARFTGLEDFVNGSGMLSVEQGTPITNLPQFRQEADGTLQPILTSAPSEALINAETINLAGMLDVSRIGGGFVMGRIFSRTPTGGLSFTGANAQDFVLDGTTLVRVSALRLGLQTYDSFRQSAWYADRALGRAIRSSECDLALISKQGSCSWMRGTGRIIKHKPGSDTHYDENTYNIMGGFLLSRPNGRFMLIATYEKAEMDISSPGSSNNGSADANRFLMGMLIGSRGEPVIGNVDVDAQLRVGYALYDSRRGLGAETVTSEPELTTITGVFGAEKRTFFRPRGEIARQLFNDWTFIFRSEVGVSSQMANRFLERGGDFTLITQDISQVLVFSSAFGELRHLTPMRFGTMTSWLRIGADVFLGPSSADIRGILPLTGREFSARGTLEQAMFDIGVGIGYKAAGIEINLGYEGSVSVQTDTNVHNATFRLNYAF